MCGRLSCAASKIFEECGDYVKSCFPLTSFCLVLVLAVSGLGLPDFRRRWYLRPIPSNPEEQGSSSQSNPISVGVRASRWRAKLVPHRML